MAFIVDHSSISRSDSRAESESRYTAGAHSCSAIGDKDNIINVLESDCLAEEGDVGSVEKGAVDGWLCAFNNATTANH